MSRHGSKRFRLTAAVVAGGLAVLAAPSATAHGGGYEEVAVANGGTIQGTVHWAGEAPHLEGFPITKNPEACDLHQDGVVENPRLIVDPETGGVADAVVFLKDIAAGKSLEGAIPKEVSFDQVACRYSPHVCILRRKGKLMLQSSDDVLHNVRAEGAASFNKAMPTPGIVMKQKLRKQGIVRISCDAGHYWMSATVFVVEHPYYALSDAKGTFTLTDVPPGTYTLVLWKENWKVAEKIEKEGAVSRLVYGEPIVIEQQVVVEAGGIATVDFTIPAGEA